MVEVMSREGAHVPNQAYQHLVEIETWELIAKSDSTIDELVGGESLKWVMDYSIGDIWSHMLALKSW